MYSEYLNSLDFESKIEYAEQKLKENFGMKIEIFS